MRMGPLLRQQMRHQRLHPGPLRSLGHLARRVQELQRAGHSATKRAATLEDTCRRVTAEVLRRSGGAQARGGGGSGSIKGLDDALRAAAECAS